MDRGEKSDKSMTLKMSVRAKNLGFFIGDTYILQIYYSLNFKRSKKLVCFKSKNIYLTSKKQPNLKKLKDKNSTMCIQHLLSK